MASSGKASFTWNQTVLANVRREFGAGMVNLATEVSRRAKINAPVLNGNLRRSIRVTPDGQDIVYVIAGGKYNNRRVPYAKRREYENKAHPSTRLYMHRAFESVARGNIAKYWRING